MSLSEVIFYSSSDILTSSSYFNSLTHGKVCIKEPSLDELNLKVVETTCQVHVNKKDKDEKIIMVLSKVKLMTRSPTRQLWI